MDFYRGTLSSRRLALLVTDLYKKPTSSLLREVNDGNPGFSPTDHLLADIWLLNLNIGTHGKTPIADHPVRAAMEQKLRAAAKEARVVELKADFQRRKRKYSSDIGKEA